MFKQKQFLSLFLSIMILFSILAVADVSSFAVADDIDVFYEEESTDFEEDFSEPDYDENKYGYLAYEVIADEVIITDCDDTAEGEIIVPETIEGYPVTAIGDNAFKYCYSITAVVLPDSVKEIGSNAFHACYRLENVNIPEAVKTLKEFTFLSCYSLKEFIIPDNIASVEMCVFSSCYNLEKVVFPDSITEISTGMFTSCFNLKEITIPDTVTKIGDAAFVDCWSLESITIPENVESIGITAFDNVPCLKNIYIYNPDIKLEHYICYEDVCGYGNSIINEVSVPDDITVNEFDEYYNFIIKCVNIEQFGDINSEEYIELIEKWQQILEGEFHDVRTDLTIHGYDESTAHDFADKNGINFVSFESEEVLPDEPQPDDSQDDVTDNTCSRCGEVHSNAIEELFCTIKSFFTKIIDFLKSLFVQA